MAIETYTRISSGLTPEELAMLEEAEHLPQVYDEDCPKLTPEQLTQFRPINGMTWEERARLMQEAGSGGFVANILAI
jgi:hypothetical protein